MCDSDTSSRLPPQAVEVGADIVYTYDVYWQESETKWASRCAARGARAL